MSDIVSGAGLHSWSEMGLIICFITFVALLIWLFVIRRGPTFEEESRLPLDDDLVALPTTSHARPNVPANSEEVEDQ